MDEINCQLNYLSYFNRGVDSVCKSEINLFIVS